MHICNKIRNKNKSKKRAVWDGSEKRVEGTVFAEFKDKRSQTPEIVKEWKTHGRRWKQERAMFREIMGADEEKDVGPIKALEAPKIVPGNVGNVLPTACDYKLPEDHVKKFTAPKKKRRSSRSLRLSAATSSGKKVIKPKASSTPRPLREHTELPKLTKEEIEALKLELAEKEPKPTSSPVFNSPERNLGTRKSKPGKKQASLKSRSKVNELRERSLLKKHNEQMKKKTPVVVKQSKQNETEVAGGEKKSYSTTTDEYRAREKIRRQRKKRKKR